MQLSALLFTQLPQYLLNLTNPSPTPPSAPITNPSSSILPEDMAMAKFTLPALPYAYDVSFIPHLILIWVFQEDEGLSDVIAGLGLFSRPFWSWFE